MENFPQNGKKFLYTNIEINNKVPWTELWFWLSVHCTENHIFLFPDVLKRWSFQKNCARIWSFLHYWERWYFFFPKIWSYTLGEKWKMIFLKKNRWKYDIFFESSEKMVFPRRAPPAHDLSCIIWRDGIFFPENIFFPFLRKYMEIWHFLCSRTGATSVPPHTSIKKNLSILCTFMVTFTGVFMHCSLAKKNRKLNI